MYKFARWREGAAEPPGVNTVEWDANYFNNKFSPQDRLTPYPSELNRIPKLVAIKDFKITQSKYC